MNKSKAVIVLEFNELCPTLMKKFMDEGMLPNFERLHDGSRVYRTAAEDELPNLEPWIQWVTVHAGVPFNEHGVFDLDDGYKLKQSQIWEIVAQQGKRAWICGSMNVKAVQDQSAYVVPDPWSRHVTPSPAGEFDDYINFVRKHVQEHTNAEARLSFRENLKFLRFMLTHGLTFRTVLMIVRQIVTERLTDRFHWRRATILDSLQWDVFSWYHQKIRPEFATFFANSTAHFQHMYWRNMQPELFENKPTKDDQLDFENAVLWGYQAMDKVVARCLNLADADTTIILCTALSQQPCLQYEATGGKHIYRPADIDGLLAFAGIEPGYDCSPLMSEEYLLRFEKVELAESAERLLRLLSVDDRPLMRVRRSEGELVVGCGITDEIESSAGLKGGDKTTPFFDMFYKFRELKSGMHHPDGILWIWQQQSAHTVSEEKVPLMAIAPTVLDILDLPKPSSMETPALN